MYRIILLWRMAAMLINEADILKIWRADHTCIFADPPPYQKDERIFCRGNAQALSISNPPI